MRVKAPVGIAYDSDIDFAESLMMQATRSVARVLGDPEPKVLLMAFGARAVEFEIRFWISDPEEGLSNVRSEVLKQVWHLFREHGIELPFPQQDVRVKEWPQPSAEPREASSQRPSEG